MTSLDGIIMHGIQTSPSPVPPTGWGVEMCDMSDYVQAYCFSVQRVPLVHFIRIIISN